MRASNGGRGDGMTRKIPAWLRLGLALSGVCYTMLLMQTPSHISFAVTAALSLSLLLGLMFRSGLPEQLLSRRSPGVCVVAAVLSLSAVYTAKSTFFTTCWRWMDKLVTALGLPEVLMRLIPWAVALAAVPMAFVCFLWFVDLMRELGKKLWTSSDFTERLFVLAAGILFGMMILFTHVCTQAFYGAHLNGSWYNFDLIYSADSGYLMNQDVFRNVGAEQNDLRQPLFGLFAMPFAQTAWLLSRILFFLPNCYVTIWQIIQMLLFLVAVVLLSRMMELQKAEKALFLVLCSVTYPVLIFVLTTEQYLVEMFYLMLLLYLGQEERGKKLSFVAATGCMLTSGAWFPLVTWDRDFRKFVKKTLTLLGVFVAFTVLSGRLTTFLDIPTYIEGYVPYTGVTVSAVSKLKQFVNFAGACLIAPKSGVDTTSYHHISWQMLPVTGWSPAGLIVLALSVCSMIVGWKKTHVRRCAFWIGFSLLLLGIVGWGTVDNGLMLYTLYFGWAFISLIFLLLERILSRVRPLKLVLMTGMALAMAICNIYALRAVLIFAAQFYPTLGGIS